MIRKLIASATGAALLAAPIAAQAAPARTPAPIADEEEGLAGGLLLPALIAVAVAIGIYLIVDDDDNDVPVSP